MKTREKRKRNETHDSSKILGERFDWYVQLDVLFDKRSITFLIHLFGFTMSARENVGFENKRDKNEQPAAVNVAIHSYKVRRCPNKTNYNRVGFVWRRLGHCTSPSALSVFTRKCLSLLILVVRVNFLFQRLVEGFFLFFFSSSS